MVLANRERSSRLKSSDSAPTRVEDSRQFLLLKCVEFRTSGLFCIRVRADASISVAQSVLSI